MFDLDEQGCVGRGWNIGNTGSGQMQGLPIEVLDGPWIERTIGALTAGSCGSSAGSFDKVQAGMVIVA